VEPAANQPVVTDLLAAGDSARTASLATASPSPAPQKRMNWSTGIRRRLWRWCWST